MNQGIVAARPG